MVVQDDGRDVSIPILSRNQSKHNSPAVSGTEKEDSKSMTPLSVDDVENRSDDSQMKSRLDDSELKRDLVHIAFLLIISGGVVALNLLGMLTAIPGLNDHITFKIFTLKEMQKLARTLSAYASHHFVRTLTVQILLGTWVQTFMIPGATILNMLAGNNFGLWRGLAITSFYNTLGSILLYLISRSVGRRIVRRYLHDRVESFRKLFQSRVEGGGSDRSFGTVSLIIYMTSLRILPFTPNWFLNVSQASLEIPLTVFVPSLVIGTLPYNYLAVSAGTILQDLSSVKIVNTATALQLGVVATLGLATPSLLRKLKNYFNKDTTNGPTVGYYWMQVRKAGQRDEK
ncbi:hypothetical protein AAMO2058_000013700 [Amorphochlora amoebiformis]